MNERKKLIRALERAITELKVRLEDPATEQGERAEISARLAELEAQLAELRQQAIADAANDVALAAPDEATVAQMRRLARRLDDAVAKNKQTSSVIALIDNAFGILAS